jgi:hypothetical protein
VSEHTSCGADAAGEHARELTAGELNRIAGAIPNVTVNGGHWRSLLR